jgi:hypothetical protein
MNLVNHQTHEKDKSQSCCGTVSDIGNPCHNYVL